MFDDMLGGYRTKTVTRGQKFLLLLFCNQKRVNLPETVVEVIRRRRLTWFGHISRMSGTDCQPQHYTAIYQEDAAEVVHARSGSIIYKRT